jgi:hypothetical protein
MGKKYSGMCTLCGGATFGQVCIACGKRDTGDFKNSKYLTKGRTVYVNEENVKDMLREIERHGLEGYTTSEWAWGRAWEAWLVEKDEKPGSYGRMLGEWYHKKGY